MAYEVDATECHDKDFGAFLCYGYYFPVQEFNEMLCLGTEWTEAALNTNWRENVTTIFRDSDIVFVEVLRYSNSVYVSGQTTCVLGHIGTQDNDCLVIKDFNVKEGTKVELKKFAKRFGVQGEPTWLLIASCA